MAVAQAYSMNKGIKKFGCVGEKAVHSEMKQRDVCVVDIPRAFVQKPNEKVNQEHPPDLTKVKERLVDMLLQIDQQLYTLFVTEENGMPVVYLEISMALYGMIKSPHLFYRKF
jgi:adenosyl cobinamide kinase/adenosyl cobinamide phosphate guanylyltransferase